MEYAHWEISLFSSGRIIEIIDRHHLLLKRWMLWSTASCLKVDSSRGGRNAECSSLRITHIFFPQRKYSQYTQILFLFPHGHMIYCFIVCLLTLFEFCRKSTATSCYILKNTANDIWLTVHQSIWCLEFTSKYIWNMT